MYKWDKWGESMSDGEIFVISCIKHRDLAFLRYHKFSRDTSTNYDAWNCSDRKENRPRTINSLWSSGTVLFAEPTAQSERYIVSHLHIPDTETRVPQRPASLYGIKPTSPPHRPKPSDILWLGPVGETCAHALCSNWAENLNFAVCCFPSFRFVVSVNFDHPISTELRKRADDFMTNLRKIKILQAISPVILHLSSGNRKSILLEPPVSD